MFLPVDGRPLVARVVAALDAAGADEVRITGGDRPRLEALGLTVDDDPVPFEGPLPGLITSLERARHDRVLVLACDLRSPSPAAVRTTLAGLGEHDAAVPTDGDRPQWLHAAWHRRALPHLAAARSAGEGAIHRAADGLSVATVEGIPPAHLADVDRPEDL